jgi:polyisoprenoid-binding protein YceI
MATAASELVRQHNDTDIPAPGTYALDASHTTVEFVARHMMISKVRGGFTGVSGTVTIGESPEDSSVEATIEVGTVVSGDSKRDEHLRSPDFFDVDSYPTISFRSTQVREGKRGRWEVDGDLTLRDITRPVTLDVEFEGGQTTPWGSSAIGFSASTEVDREDWGLTWNAALETGGVVVGKKIRLELNVEAIKQ